MSAQSSRTRFVYFIGTVGAPFVKIGMSETSVARRVDSLQVGCPYDLTVLHVIGTLDAGALERELHSRFKDQHVRGEWFYLDGPVSEYLSAAAEPCLCPVCLGKAHEFRCTTCRTTIYRTDWLLADPDHVICWDCSRRLAFNTDDHVATHFDEFTAYSRWHVNGAVA